ncbi:MAG TPA: PIN domain-containing protein [Candidatus Saccharimonadales bacterium]|jgi:predicted nucleic-acid-binding protein|nr:PIN domain-containing protein [Candidatus Saccharimonadales bacterium]
MKRSFIDANVLIEVLMNRLLSAQCLEILNDTSRQYGISVLTVHIVWYIAEKYKLEQAKVDDMLSPWEVLPISGATIKAARGRYDGKDFEDCIQAVCAEEGEYDEIVTIDKNFQKHSDTKLHVSVVSQSS